MTEVQSRPKIGATLRRLAATDLAPTLAAAALSTLFASVVLKVWKTRFDVPFAYSWDANQFGMYVKGILDHGWYYRNSNLGAPFGQQLYDYPNVTTDDLQALAIKLLGVFSSDWATVMNVYFLLTFPLAAAAAYIAFRRLGATKAPGVVCAILFALLPYHFARGERHLFYSGYFAVPIGAYLALAVFTRKPLFARRDDRRGWSPLAWATRRSLLTVALCAVVTLASGAGYYAVFTVLLVAGGMLAALVAGRGTRTVVTGGAVIAVIGVAMAANLSPSILYTARHGSNAVAGQRSWTESEFQALKLTELVLPIEHHRIAKLAHVSQKYAAFERSLGQAPGRVLVQGPSEAETVHLGIVATLGFAALLLVALAAAIGGRSRPGHAAYRPLAAASLIAFLIGTVGGISALIAGAISPQFRSWNRISLFIAFFALLAVALFLSGLDRRFRATRARQAGFAALLVVILGVGVLDQTSSADVPDYRSITASYSSDGAFVRKIEQRLGGHGSIFELPYVPFPDGGVTYRLTDYDLVHGYLHSDSLRWSFGAMKGRPQDWQAELSEQPVAVQIRAAAGAGFDGVYVDRYGYADSANGLERALRRLTREQALESPDHRLFFFDLRGLRRRLVRGHTRSQVEALRQATLEPLRTEWLTGFGPVKWIHGQQWRSTGTEAELAIVNPSRRARRASFEAVLATRRPASATVIVTYPDRSSARITATSSGASIQRVLEFAPGTSVIRVEILEPAAGAPPLSMRTLVVDDGFWPFGSKRPQAT
jgi:phosphoglycerol transferase